MATKGSTTGGTSPTISLENAFTGADLALRALARASVGLERARAGARVREAARIAAKYGAAHARAKAATMTARVHADQLADAVRLAGRADVAPVEVADDAAAVVGRVIERGGAAVAGATVQAIDAHDKALAHAHTDAAGRFRLSFEGVRAPKAAGTEEERIVTLGQRAQGTTVEEPAAAPAGETAAMRLVVTDGKAERHRDAQGFTVEVGRVLYREITIVR